MSTLDIIAGLRDDPDSISRLSGREFEEVVAELLASFGWDVSLGSGTQDAGYDILAVARDPLGFDTAWAIECKVSAPNHRVPAAQLRDLYGVKQALGLPQALLVTTSTLTSGAREFADGVGEIKVADGRVVSEWLQRYQFPPARRSHLESRLFQSCFVSYSHKDEEFASRLVARLRAEGVKVWFAPDDLLPGRKIHEEIGSAVETFDRLVVVLSENSMHSPWVESEVRRARRREIRDGRRVLFPISLVPFDVLKKWELFDSDAGQDLAVELREYLIPDFSDWNQASAFEKQVKALLAGLRASEPPRKASAR